MRMESKSGDHRFGRQGWRRLIGVVIVLSFPITMNWFSPYLSVSGAWLGLISGSVLFFGILTLSAIILGRGFCGWVCPMGALQDILRPVRDTRVGRIRWVKFVVWGLWFAALAMGFVRSWGPPVVNALFATEGGVSVAQPFQYLIYGFVLALFIAVTLAVGRRGACHTVCWIAPFMIGGRGLGNALGLPALRLRAAPLRCTACGSCRKACPMSLHVPEMARSGKTDHRDCALCGECVDACPEDTLRFGFGRPA